MQIEMNDVAELLRLSSRKVHPWKIGEKYIIRTIAYFAVGRLTFVGDHELVLDEACWVACTKRYADTLRTGELEEVEPSRLPKIIGRASIVDADIWEHALPRDQI